MSHTTRRWRLATLATTAAVCVTLPLGAATAALVDDPVRASAPGAALRSSRSAPTRRASSTSQPPRSSSTTPRAQRLLVVNAAQAKVEVLDASDPAPPPSCSTCRPRASPPRTAPTVPGGAVANSVAVREDGLGVVAVEADRQDRQRLAGVLRRRRATVPPSARSASAPCPTWSPSAATAPGPSSPTRASRPRTTAVDPEGTVSVVDAARLGHRRRRSPRCRTADFHAFEGAGRCPTGIRVYGGRADAGTGTPTYPVSENLEPEYVAIDQQSRTAYVTLQEANGIAVVDLRSAHGRGPVVAGHGRPLRGAARRQRPRRRINIRTLAGARVVPAARRRSPRTRSGARPTWSPPTRATPATGTATRRRSGSSDLGKDGLKPLCDARRAQP